MASDLFDFSKYYKPMKANAEIQVDVSGIDLKSGASSETVNEDGTVDDVKMNEYVTNNVKYYVESIEICALNPLSTNDADKYQLKGAGTKIGYGDVLKFNVCTYIPESDEQVAHEEQQTGFIAVGYPASLLMENGAWEGPTTPNNLHNKPIEIELVSEQYTLDENTDGSVIRGYLIKQTSKPTTHKKSPRSLGQCKLYITIMPRYQRIVNESGDISQNFNFGNESFIRCAAACGIMNDGNVYVDGDRMAELLKNDPRIEMEYKTFKRLFNKIAKVANPNNIGLEITYYDDKYKVKNPLTYPSKKDYKKNYWKARADAISYNLMEEKCDFTKTTEDGIFKTRVSELGSMYMPWKSRVDNFIAKPPPGVTMDYDYLVADISEKNQSSTALIPNVADAFKAMYYDKKLLSDQFCDYYVSVFKGLRDRSLLLKLLPSKYKSKLNALVGDLLVEYHAGVDAVPKPPFLIDLAAVTTHLFCGLNKNRPQQWKQHDKAGSDYNVRQLEAFPRAISPIEGRVLYFDFTASPYQSDPNYHRGDVRLFQHTNTFKYEKDKNDIVMYAPWFQKYSKATTYSGTGTSLEKILNNNVIDSVRMTASEVERELLDVYNIWFNKYIVRNDKDDKDDPDVRTAEWSIVDPYNDLTDFKNAAGEDIEVNSDYYAAKVTINYVGNGDDKDPYEHIYYQVYLDDGHKGPGMYVFREVKDEKNNTVYYSCGTGNGNYDSDDIPDKTNTNTHNMGLAAFLNHTCKVINVLRTGKETFGVDLDDSPKLDGDYDVIKWDDCSVAPDNINYRHRGDYPSFKTDTDFGDSDCDIDYFCDKVELFGDIIEAMDTAITALCVYPYSWPVGIYQRSKLKTVKRNYDRLLDVIDKIKYYQQITAESVFENLSFIGDRVGSFEDPPLAVTAPARFILPVHMYKKVKKKYRNWLGLTRHKMVSRSIGVRWVEVRYIDTSVYSEYPPNDNELTNDIIIDEDAEVSTFVSDGITMIKLDFGKNLEETKNDLHIKSFTYATNGMLYFGNSFDSEFYYECAITSGSEIDSSPTTATAVTDWVAAGPDGKKEQVTKLGKVHVWGLKLPLEPTSESDELTKVTVNYKMPYIPYDNEIRNKSFVEYGAFDQSKYAVPMRGGDVDPDRLEGWRIFKNSTRRVQDMRPGLGIYDALSMLVAILRNAFGERRVRLVETIRSREDQSNICMGGAESEYLSWHNYGLSAKILILKEDLRSSIDEHGDDMLKLIDIAEAFTEACYYAKICPQPINVVWCGRLVMGANNFVWEFLPIGVHHKDAPKFREALIMQHDPVVEYGYVNVDAGGLAVDAVPEDKDAKYILRTSSGYKNAEIINGEHYVNPRFIVNFGTNEDLVLVNIAEYIKMIQLKLAAHGTTLTDRANMYDWKALNDQSYRQLVKYFGMIGNFSGAKSLIAGDFVEKYQNIVDQYYNESAVAFVQAMLGDHYKEIKIYVTNMGDGASYFMLHDGKLHMKVTECRPSYDPKSKDHFHSQKQTNPTSIERGRWIKGVFYKTYELETMDGVQLEYVSERPMISGFENDGTISGGDAYLLHSIMAAQIKRAYDELKESFENYAGQLMYDRFEDGPNYKLFEMLENEFGIIAAQDLMSFDKLRAMIYKDRINALADKTNDGTVLGAGANEEDRIGERDGVTGYGTGLTGTGDALSEDLTDTVGTYWESIFEKVVSNAQLSGVRKASLTREHVKETQRDQGIPLEKLYKMMTKGKGVSAKDILGR